MSEILTKYGTNFLRFFGKIPSEPILGLNITGEAGYKTLLLAVYKTSLFFGGSEVAVYKTSLLFRRPQVAVYKTLLFSESQNLQKVFFQIWLFIRPH